MKMRKKIGLFFAVSLMLLSVIGCGSNSASSGNGANAQNNGAAEAGNAQNAGSGGGKDNKTYKIAISQIVEHPSLDATREGFMAALKDAGLVEGQNLQVDYNNAQGDQPNNMAIAQKSPAEITTWSWRLQRLRPRLSPSR
ncbi:hypothetical protein HMSSN036_57000 [Paenibacillus macerans]|nr:hypothetical protein HMSSN036_57000 [Paenibacillus macerans]